MEIGYESSHYLRVRYGETDKMGYCYYGNYAEFLEVGRVEALRSKGITYRELEESGVMLPVSEFHIRYLAPAKYDDLLKIITRITKLKGSRLCFEYEIFNEANIKLIQAETTLVFVNAETMKPMPAPETFLNVFHD
jgi:acyl-CoA thioester hydrolase